MNTVLKSKHEWQKALHQVQKAGLPPHIDPQKNWDHLAALDFILRHTKKSARVLDAGGEIYSPLVDWLGSHGYKRLHVLNLSFKRAFMLGPIRYQRGDCTSSPYPSDHFDVVACLSVIEHGVHLDKFLKESRRILRPGGHLIVSTDYWKSPIKTSGKRAYGTRVKIFTEEGIRRLIDRAHAAGFAKTGAIDTSVREKAVHWNGTGLNYTFILFALQKVPKG